MKNKNLHLLRRYIKEAIDLGNYEFAPNRLDLTPEQQAEENTEDEERLYTALRLRLDNVQDIDKKTAKELSDLIKSKYGEKGSKFFRGPHPNKLLYRGDAVGEDWVKEHMPDDHTIPSAKTVVELPEALMNQRLVMLKKPFTFRDRRGWSYVSDTAYRWSTSYVDRIDNPYAVVLTISTNDIPKNSMIDFGYNMYRTTAGESYQDEHEVMNLKPVTVKLVQIARLGAQLAGDIRKIKKP
jgi:hypothetical protein